MAFDVYLIRSSKTKFSYDLVAYVRENHQPPRQIKGHLLIAPSVTPEEFIELRVNFRNNKLAQLIISAFEKEIRWALLHELEENGGYSAPDETSAGAPELAFYALAQLFVKEYIDD